MQDLIKSSDIFGTPVSLYYRGESSFRSTLGGCLSIFFALAIGGYFITETVTLFRNPSYQQSFNTHYHNMQQQNVTYTLDTKNHNLVAGFYPTSYTFEQEASYARVQFRAYQDGEWIWIPTVLCSDLYADQIESGAADGFYRDSFLNSIVKYYCPNIEQIKISASDAEWGTISMVVNSCEVAYETAQYEQIEDVYTQYGNNCKTLEESVKWLESPFNFFLQKILTQSFNLDQAAQDDGLVPYLAFAGDFSLSDISTINQELYITRETISVDSRLWGLAFWETPDEVEVYHTQASTTNSLYPKGYREAPTYGFYRFDLIQGSRVTTTKYQIQTLAGLLSAVGGLFTSLCGGLATVVAYYQQFSMDKSLLGQLYKERRQNEADENSHGDLLDKYRAQLQDRQEFAFGWWNWLGKRIWFDFLCCCLNKSCARRSKGWSKQLKQLRRYQAARQALHEEQDLQSIMDVHRLARFLSKVLLTRKQRLTVPYFRKYVVSSNQNLAQPSEHAKKPQLPFYDCFELSENLSFEGDKWDERLLYEVTGEKLDDNKYLDETSDDEASEDEVEDPLAVVFSSNPDRVSSSAVAFNGGTTIQNDQLLSP